MAMLDLARDPALRVAGQVPRSLLPVALTPRLGQSLRAPAFAIEVLMDMAARVVSRLVVMVAVRSAVRELQVRRIVVQLVVVPVVHHFMPFQRAAKDALHDQSVFVLVGLGRDQDAAIAVLDDPAFGSGRPLAAIRMVRASVFRRSAPAVMSLRHDRKSASALAVHLPMIHPARSR